MRVLPILFNTEMVRAILDGRKTVTRRVVKDPYHISGDGEVCRITGLAIHKGTNVTHGAPYPDSPYRPGDILYVRETWRPHSAWSGSYSSGCEIEYKAGGENLIIDGSVIAVPERETPWRPSIHMPREAARIWLRVTDVRVERLQDMTEDDVIDEGAEPLIQCPNEHRVYDGSGSLIGMCWNEDCCSGGCNFISKSYGELFGEMVWNSTIKPKGRDKYGWTANPYVWVIEFERCEKPEVAT